MANGTIISQTYTITNNEQYHYT